MLTGKRILLGVTGGIAAYKSANLVREFVRAGAEVQVVMTRSAAQFITPLTMASLSKRDVVIDMFPPAPDQPPVHTTRHIDLALWGDVMLIAPATANTIAKLTHGVADNFLTTLVLALRCPLIIAPAMDVDMYLHEMTQSNITALRETGCIVLDPDDGELASGLSGPGRMPEVDRLFTEVGKTLDNARHDLSGRSILVTAGPTHEPIDPVRFIGNRSSGKMGFALANAAAQRGGIVTLISGPVALRTPRNVKRIDVTTTREMAAAVMQGFPSCDLLVMAAAVADFAPLRPAVQKIKRSEGGLILELAENPDILKTAGAQKSSQTIIGFALETQNGLESARKKLRVKNLDMIVLNNPMTEGAGFGSASNAVTVITASGEEEQLPLMPKIDVAHLLLSRVLPLLR